MNCYRVDFQKNEIFIDQFLSALQSDTETTNNALKGFSPYKLVNKKCFRYAVEEKEMHVSIFNALMNNKDSSFRTGRLLTILQEICKSEKVSVYTIQSGNIYLLRSIGTNYISNARITNTIIRIMVEIIKHKNKSIAIQICTCEDILYVIHVIQMYQKRSSAVIVSLCLYTQYQLNTQVYQREQGKLLKLCRETVEHWTSSTKIEKRTVVNALNVIISMMEQ
jgi:hypothetical protein